MFGLNGKKNGSAVFRTFAACLALVACFLAFRRMYPLEHAALIEKYSKEYSISPAFVCAVIKAESGFRKNASSHKGAGGLMQITEPTAVWLADKIGIDGFEYEMIYDPETNINIGCYYIRLLFDKYHGDESLTLAAYNAGEGTVARWLSDPRYSADGETLYAVPFKETRNYLRRVRFNAKIYRVVWKIYSGL
ncbi:MAG: lytic transglycosylase domain-containing protein [Clostridiales bacterium]|jgi:soluble lytic murein transglycosylase|nr:lytic transglycosylase domain-containing protein [Clostridiales bacterium]